MSCFTTEAVTQQLLVYHFLQIRAAIRVRTKSHQGQHKTPTPLRNLTVLPIAHRQSHNHRGCASPVFPTTNTH